MGIGKKIVGNGCFTRDEFIIKQCKGKRVLHVGCTDHPFFKSSLANEELIHTKVSEVATKVIGIDIALEDVASMVSHGYDVRVIDAQTMSSHEWGEAFDIVLLGDVIEHITNPGMVIEEARKVLAVGGKIVITVPNAFGIIRYVKSFFRYEQVHSDHVAYYSSGVLDTLARNTSLIIEQSAWYRFEARDKRPIVYLSAFLERIVTTFFPWQSEGCIAVMTLPSTTNHE